MMLLLLAALALPVYDVDAYCAGVAASAANDPKVAAGCLDQEARAKVQVEKLNVTPDALQTCHEESELLGGSYALLYGCLLAKVAPPTLQ
ncbi:hypothetical protein [Zavarzinia sp. CC-PAN008]|uniref:hypothetical protein n=1 Tax=Zavarzinia sp. CC-PAN008 TaxID=3243332 RepID=UPI003F7458F0